MFLWFPFSKKVIILWAFPRTGLIFFNDRHFHFGLPDKLPESYANLQMPAQRTRIFSRKLHGGCARQAPSCLSGDIALWEWRNPSPDHLRAPVAAGKLSFYLSVRVQLLWHLPAVMWCAARSFTVSVPVWSRRIRTCGSCLKPTKSTWWKTWIQLLFSRNHHGCRATEVHTWSPL